MTSQTNNSLCISCGKSENLTKFYQWKEGHEFDMTYKGKIAYACDECYGSIVE